MSDLKAHVGRLTKLFKLMMSADAAGEVVNARDAIVRILKDEERDIHDLADVLVAGLDPKQQEIVIYKPPSLNEPAQDVAFWCLFQYEKRGFAPQSSREIEFLRDMTRMWGTPTEKQSKWLAAIHNRLVRQLGPDYAY